MSTARLAAHADLPGVEQLLEPGALSALHGEDLSLLRGRLKPGASALVAHCQVAAAAAGADARAGAAGGTDAADQADAARGPSPEGIGWTLLIVSPHKRDGVLRRAARSGAEVHEHTGPAEGPFLLSGGLEADPRLGRLVHRVLRSLRQTPRVLSYNPARHLVLHLPQTGQVVRIATRPLDDLLQVTRCWTALGVPTIAQRPWRRRSSVLVSEHWGTGDLAHHAQHPRALRAAEAAGAALSQLHDAAVAADELPEARLGERIPATLPEIAALLPEQAPAVHRLERLLRDRLPERPRTGLIHGDLSPDQVLLDLQDTGSLPQIRVIDLDRSGHGPLGADLGSWLAACLSADTSELGAALLAGYARAGTPPEAEELAAWTARALLAGAVDPVRRFRTDWPILVGRRLELAAAILEDPAHLTRLLSAAPRGDRGAPVAATGPTAPAVATDSAATDPAAPVVPAVPDAVTDPAVAVVPERVLADGAVWAVDRAWPHDGRGIPLELRAADTEDTDDPEDPEDTADIGNVEDTGNAEDPAERTDSATARRGPRGARLDPETGEVTVFAPGTDPRLPGLARCLDAHPDAEVVSHRPGKRAVVRVPAAGEQGERYVKIVRPGRAQRLRDALTNAASFDGPFRLQQEITADEDSVTTAALAGRTLHEGLPLEDGVWRRAWRETLTAWAQALAAGPVTPPDGAVHGPAEESAVLESWRDRARLVDPLGSDLRDRAIEAARRELGRLTAPERPALIHRDLHDKQILHAPGLAPGLLDVDTAVLGDPALDLANLRAHASWRELQGIWNAEHARIAREEIDAAALRARIPAATLAAYESGTLARLTCVYAFRPRWRALARELAADLRPAPGAPPVAPDDLLHTPDERTVTT